MMMIWWRWWWWWWWWWWYLSSLKLLSLQKWEEGSMFLSSGFKIWGKNNGEEQSPKGDTINFCLSEIDRSSLKIQITFTVSVYFGSSLSFIVTMMFPPSLLPCMIFGIIKLKNIWSLITPNVINKRGRTTTFLFTISFHTHCCYIEWEKVI